MPLVSSPDSPTKTASDIIRCLLGIKLSQLGNMEIRNLNITLQTGNALKLFLEDIRFALKESREQRGDMGPSKLLQ